MVITVTFDKLFQIMLGWKKKIRNEKFENSQESNRDTDFSSYKIICVPQLRLSSELKEGKMRPNGKKGSQERGHCGLKR